MGLIKLTLQQEDQGQVLGQLTGAGIDCLIQGSLEASGISGTVSGYGTQLKFVAQLEEDELFLKLFELDPYGQPDYASAQTLIFLRQPDATDTREPREPAEGMPGTSPDAPDGSSPIRNVVVNGVRLGDLEVSALEQEYGIQIEDAAYWYDKLCGAWGLEGGSTAGFIFPYLDLGGPLRADASGGNTHVFVNGRELHQYDVLSLQQLLGPLVPGRYWLDAQGNAGIEGGPILFNLIELAKAAGGGQGSTFYRSNITDIGAGSSGGTSYVMGKDWSVTVGD
jgi:hypothetical protein